MNKLRGERIKTDKTEGELENIKTMELMNKCKS